MTVAPPPTPSSPADATPERPGLSPIQAKLANLLGAVALGVTDRMRAATDRVLVSGGETAAALVAIGMTPGLTVADLAQALGLSHPGGVRAVDRLQRDGLVARGRGTDRRNVTLTLTAEGVAMRDRVLRARAEVLAALVGGLEPAEALKLGMVLDGLVGQLAPDPVAARALCRLCAQEWCGSPGCKARRVRAT